MLFSGVPRLLTSLNHAVQHCKLGFVGVDTEFERRMGEIEVQIIESLISAFHQWPNVRSLRIHDLSFSML